MLSGSNINTRAPNTHMKLAYLFAQCSQLLGVYPAPYPFHVIPVRNDAVFHRVFNLQQSAKLLRFPSNEHVALKRTSHDAYVLRPSDTA